MFIKSTWAAIRIAVVRFLFKLFSKKCRVHQKNGSIAWLSFFLRSTFPAQTTSDFSLKTKSHKKKNMSQLASVCSIIIIGKSHVVSRARLQASLESLYVLPTSVAKTGRGFDFRTNFSERKEGFCELFSAWWSYPAREKCIHCLTMSKRISQPEARRSDLQSNCNLQQSKSLRLRL